MITPKYAYVDVRSKFHDLNPISKTIWLLCLSILAVFALDIGWLSLIFLLVFATGLSANLGLRRMLDAMKPMKPFITILIFSPTLMLLPGFGDLFPSSSPMMLLVEAMAYGMIIALRFCCILYSAFVFIATTKLKDFVYATTRFGVPYRYAFMLITVFRLIPSIEMDVNNIMYAQMARGLQMEKIRGLKKFINFTRYTIKPLLISSLRRGLVLSTSMDSACFGAYEKRTFLDEVTVSRTDIVFSFILLSVTALILYGFFTGNLPIIFDFSETIRKTFFPSGLPTDR